MMFHKLKSIQRVHRTPELSAHECAVLIAMIDTADDCGSGYAGVPTLAQYSHISPRTVRRAMKSLEARGVILRKRRNRQDGSRTSDRYTIMIDRLPASETGRTEQSQAASQTGRTEQSQAASQTGRTEQSQAASQTGRTEQSQAASQTGRTEQSQAASQTKPSGQPVRAKRPARQGNDRISYRSSDRVAATRPDNGIDYKSEDVVELRDIVKQRRDEGS